jgi:transcriptional regulator with XRE-family HTH domain
MLSMAKPTKLHPVELRAMADRLRALRLATGKGQKDFAEGLGLGEAQWANFEAAQSRIGIDAALVLLREMKVPLDWIYAGETAMLPSGLKAKIDAAPPRPVRRSSGTAN